MRVERSAALLATIYANSHTKGGGYEILDFMDHEYEQPISLEEAMKSWA